MREKVLQLKISFHKTTMTNEDARTFETESLFGHVDIQVDDILSHTWLAKRKLGGIH